MFYRFYRFNNQTPSTQVYIQDVPVNKHIYAVQNIIKISTSITYFVFIVELRIVLLLIKWCWLIRLTFPENSLWTRSEANAVAWGEVMSLLSPGTPEIEGIGLGPFVLQLHEKIWPYSVEVTIFWLYIIQVDMVNMSMWLVSFTHWLHNTVAP